jgi:hypothetical protein
MRAAEGSCSVGFRFPGDRAALRTSALRLGEAACMRIKGRKEALAPPAPSPTTMNSQVRPFRGLRASLVRCWARWRASAPDRAAAALRCAGLGVWTEETSWPGRWAGHLGAEGYGMRVQELGGSRPLAARKAPGPGLRLRARPFRVHFGSKYTRPAPRAAAWPSRPKQPESTPSETRRPSASTSSPGQ